MEESLIRSIVIAGGGVAGWMSAAVLARALRGRCAITVIDSDVGSLEPEIAALPQLGALHSILGIDDAELVRNTGATFRLGWEQLGWGATRYFIPLGELGPKLDGLPFFQNWLKLRQSADQADLANYSLCTVAARAMRFVWPSQDQRSVLSTLAYALQIDTGLYAEYLRAIAVKHGAVRHAGGIAAVKRRDDGTVEAVRLENGERREADFFIDCTGQAALLIGEIAEFEDWSRWLPCDSVVTASSGPLAALPPYAVARTAEAGWQWQVALQHRTGHGYVYSSRHIGDDKAAAALAAQIAGPPSAPARVCRFLSGRRKKFWTGNVVAIGSAAAVLDPLQGSNMHVVQAGIMRLLAYFPDRTMAASERGEYNRLVTSEVERLRDFLIAQYSTSARRDTAFWRECAEITPPEPLQYKQKLFASRGRIALLDDEVFNEQHWAALFLGQGLIPDRYDPVLDGMDKEQMQMQCRRIQSAIRQGADSMPGHGQFIAKLRAAKSR